MNFCFYKILAFVYSVSPLPKKNKKFRFVFTAKIKDASPNAVSTQT